jgi:tetratricopeptide (TPR) repeat protein
MKEIIVIVLMFSTLIACGQSEAIPKPPEPPIGESDSSQHPLRMYGQQVKVILPTFEIPISASNDINSIYYFKTVEDKLNKLDTTITPEQVISLTKYNIYTKQILPKFLDSLGNQTYKLIEAGKYEKAIALAKIILNQSPNNITGQKEISLAYKRLGKDSLASLHFEMMKKIINSVFKYSDGSYENPYLVNNFYEGFSIYEAAFRCIPRKSALILDKKNRLLGAYNGYSSAIDDIFIRYFELTHWKSQLKEGDYRKEEDLGK